MSGIFLTSCTNFFLIRWIANILGFIMNLFYEIINKFGLGKISICIIAFTIIVKVLMLPINIKQQRSMKLNSIITPQVQAIQKKYANKKDNESLMKQQQEISALYQKYGTSPTGGCLPMLLQMPIIFALYAVMACIPNYVNDIQDMYNNGVVSYLVDNDYETIYSLKDIDALSDTLFEDEDEDSLDMLVTAYFGKDGDYDKDKIKETIYTSFTSAYSTEFGRQSAWDVVDAAFHDAIEDIEKLKELSEEEWKAVTDEKLAAYASKTEGDWDKIISSYEKIIDDMQENRTEIKKAYSFFTIDLSTSPANGVKIAIIIPILSALAQLLNMKISSSSQQTGNASADQMMSSMKIMSYSMCVVSAVLCYTLPAGLGLYWTVSSFVQVVIQILLNRHFKDMDVDTIVKENLEKVNKKRAKAGLPPNTISTAAATSTKNYKPQVQLADNDNTSDSASVKRGSISEKANLAKKYMDKK
ncbi:MAG: YidC/Oxa1 family membrane protein insertase [Lachnospiraceae bacterium]|nr:YidC/Oxa1 family membrane protein insertase [Lachnospiraceae bacterium]MCI8825049.1 YidC/Oxa1 family membrane protein insertase [Lachnospiraceae bacterium]MCI9369714.1 YidC/Oxa1 family membrane protein insertase [Lachnospiraceae bacterium]